MDRATPTSGEVSCFQCRRTSCRKIRGRRCVGDVRAGPPFPYLRWTGPLLSSVARVRARRSRSAGSGDRTSTAPPVDRVREREPGGVQELALEPVAAGRAVLGVAGDRVADRQQVRADLVRAARSRAARAAACRAAARARPRSG